MTVLGVVLVASGAGAVSGVPVTIPATTQTGDVLIIAATIATNGSDATPLDGWTQLTNLVGNSSTRTVTWARTAVPGDAGTVVTPTFANSNSIAQVLVHCRDVEFPTALPAGGNGTTLTAPVAPVLSPADVVYVGGLRGPADGTQQPLTDFPPGTVFTEQISGSRTGAQRNATIGVATTLSNGPDSLAGLFRTAVTAAWSAATLILPVTTVAPGYGLPVRVFDGNTWVESEMRTHDGVDWVRRVVDVVEVP